MTAKEDGKLKIIRARSKQAVDEFIEFAYRINSVYPHWIPPLRRDVRILLNRLKHPFHQHAQVEYFLAREGGRTVGRIAAIENHAHNMHHNDKAGFFGFIEAIDDPRVFRALLSTAETWCRRRGLNVIRGPFSFSTNEEAGLLVENFHSDPLLMMPFHPGFYARRIEECGYTKAEDLLCFWQTYDKIPDRVFKLADAAEKRLARGGKLHIRTLDMSRWDEELNTVQAIYNKSWSENWGFVPITDSELRFIAKELKPFVNPELLTFIEMDGKPAAFVLSVPDYNTVLKHLEGRIGPKQILLFLLLRKQIKQVRLLMMGVMPEFRNKGIEIILYRETTRNSTKNGFYAGELSWVLERNKPMLRQIEMCGAEMYRRYRVFEKPL